MDISHQPNSSAVVDDYDYDYDYDDRMVQVTVADEAYSVAVVEVVGNIQGTDNTVAVDSGSGIAVGTASALRKRSGFR